MVGLVNWGELRKYALLTTNRYEASDINYWDTRAADFNENTVNMAELTSIQLSKLPLQFDQTIIDVGAGNGRITIPVAKRVKCVTAVEPSNHMLILLKENSKKERALNISYLPKSWDDLIIGEDIYPHDLVIASFSLFMVNIENALLKIDAAANKSVYLFVSASKWVDKEIQNIVFGESIQILPDYIYIYNILHDLGILANVEINHYVHKQSYANLDEALKKISETYKVHKNNENELRKYLLKTLIEDKGKLWLNRDRKMATIWWTKTQ